MPGYLTSAELRSAGYKPNNQLHDQRAAFAWLKKNIAGFGGASDEITAVGESAGAGSPPHPLVLPIPARRTELTDSAQWTLAFTSSPRSRCSRGRS